MKLQKKVFRFYVGLISCLLSTFLGGHGFGAGTLINTPNGPVPIEQLQKNDLVISRDKINDTFVPKPIQACAKHTVSELIKLAIENTSLLVDPTQRFYVLAERKWYAAKDLKPGQVLLQNNGKFGTISGVKKVEEKAEVYDLTVQDNHNFCVSNQKILAHNCDPLSVTVTWAVAEAAMPEVITAIGWVVATTAVSWGWLSDLFITSHPNPPFTPSATNGDAAGFTDTNESVMNKTRPGGAYPDKSKQDNAKKAIVCAGGAPMSPDDDPNRNSNDKSGPKIKPKTEPTREETHPIIFDTYEQARNEALRIIGSVDQQTAIPTRSDVKGVCYNKISGIRWHGYKVGLRIDHSPEDGPHLNVTDFRPEKGPSGVNIKIKFKGDASVVESLLRPLNTIANISMAKNLGVEISKIVEGATNTNFTTKTKTSTNSIGLGTATVLGSGISQNIDANKDVSQSNTTGGITNSVGRIADAGGKNIASGFGGGTLSGIPSIPGINIFSSLSGAPSLPGIFGIPSMPSVTNFTPINTSHISNGASFGLNGVTKFGLNTGSTSSPLQNIFSAPFTGGFGF